MAVNALDLSTRARQQSIQDLPDAKRGETLYTFFAMTQRGFILPPWATREREKKLREHDRHEYNLLWQGATSGIVKKLSSVDWEIRSTSAGNEDQAAYWQDVLRQANFGSGWGDFIKKGARDFLRQDGGWYFEIIAPGVPTAEPTGAIAGIAYLDSLRCFPTGDPDYPVVYFSRLGEYHLLHRSRVVHIVDMPDGEESNPGYGLCALSRAISLTQRQILMGRYVEQNLDDNPPPGIMATNIPENEVQKAVKLYKDQQSNDSRPFWGKQLWLHHIDPTIKPELNPISFAQPPEKFSWRDYMEIDVNALALALGIDKQELWELGSGSLGSGAQSQVLAAKARGKTFGDLLTSIERAMNDILPDEFIFEFKFRDPEEDKEKAALAQSYAQTLQTIGGNLTQDEARQLLANQIEAIRDVITTPDGKLKPLNGATPAPQVVAEDNTSLDTNAPKTPTEQPRAESQPMPTPQPITRDTSTPDKSKHEFVLSMLRSGLMTIDRAQEQLGLPVDTSLAGQYQVDGVPVPPDIYHKIYESRFGRGVASFGAVVNDQALAATTDTNVNTLPVAKRKDYFTTRQQFVSNFIDLVNVARSDDMTRRRFGTVLRAQLRRLGSIAYRDGMRDGGVELDNEENLDSGDLLTIQSWANEQSTYVTHFGNEIFSRGLTDAEVTNRAEIWANKSLEVIYQKGLAAADENGLYEWSLGKTEEHCTTCLSLHGQRHRLKEYIRKRLLPKSSDLKCGGWNCDCKLTRVKGRPRGRWPV